MEEGDIPADKRDVPCLTEEEAIKISELIKAAEQAYGYPLDLEWAIDETLSFPRNVFLVQARPVTFVAEKKEPVDRILDMMLGRE